MEKEIEMQGTVSMVSVRVRLGGVWVEGLEGGEESEECVSEIKVEQIISKG